MKTVTSDQSKKGREERAPRWACPARGHARELADLDAKKHGSKDEGRGHRAIEPGPATRLGTDACKTDSETRDEQDRRLEPDIAQVEQLPTAWSPCGVPDQHRIGGEEGGEHDDVAQQENPEAVTGDNALRYQLAGCVSQPGLAACRLPVVVVAGGRLEGGHGTTCRRASAALRALRLARSMRATVSAGMMYSSTSRQAKTTNVA